MNPSIEIPHQLFTAFNNTTFHDKAHKYYANNHELISVTTLIHKYQNDFNEGYWSELKGRELNITQAEIIRAWRFINKKGTMKGSVIHEYGESRFLNKNYEYPQKLILNEFGFDPIINEYNIEKKHVDRFYNDTHDKLIPIRTEFVVSDIDSLIAGMLDILFYNIKAKEFQIWDHKTNKDLSLKNERGIRLKNELYLLEDCDLNIYSLQLGLYKYIIEKYIPIKLGNSYIVWYSHYNDNYKVIKCKDLSYYVNIIVNNRINEIKNN